MIKGITFLLLLINTFCLAQWQQTTLSGNTVYCITNKDSILFAGTNQGIFSSDDHGNNWVGINNGLTNTTILSLATNDSIMLAGTMGGGIFISNDNGQNWITTNSGITDSIIYSFCVYNNYIYAGGENGHIYSSFDNGNTWNLLNTGIFNTSVYGIMNHGSDLFCAIDFGIYESVDSGSTWFQSNVTVTSFRCFGVNGNSLFAGSGGDGIIYSNDDFNTFNVQNNGMNNLNIRSIIIRNNIVYAASYGGGVAESFDNGMNWIYINDGLNDLNINCLYTDSIYLYAGIGENGVWRRNLNEITGINALSNIIFPDNNKIIEVLDIMGRTVINNSQGLITLSELKRYGMGVYFLTLQSKKGITHRKIVVLSSN
jgi:photosystem II stability/assembly factor-like uncharacterized protein